MISNDEKLGKLEALLFIHGEPLSYGKIEKIIGLNAQETKELLEQLKEHLGQSMHGLDLIIDENRVQMVTKSQHAPLLEGFMKEQLSEDLTPASLEALAIISYMGPLSRSKLEYIRGVNSSFTLRGLMVRGLIERIPDPARNSSYLYKPSFELLKFLGLGNQSNLPQYEQFRQQLQALQEQSQSAE